MSCDNCVWGMLFAEPKLMKKENGFFSSGIRNALIEDINQSRINLYHNMIECRRFPKFETKYKTDICGEFKNKWG